jgi:hypothetical protein
MFSVILQIKLPPSGITTRVGGSGGGLITGNAGIMIGSTGFSGTSGDGFGIIYIGGPGGVT